MAEDDVATEELELKVNRYSFNNGDHVKVEQLREIDILVTEFHIIPSVDVETVHVALLDGELIDTALFNSGTHSRALVLLPKL